MRKILVTGLVFLFFITACRTIVKPNGPREAFIEQTQGEYIYEDSTDSYSGRFILFSYGDKLSIDLFAAYFPVASIRYSPALTQVYLPATAELLLLDKDDYLPLKGWEVPLSPLASAFTGSWPDAVDSSVLKGDTVFHWLGETAYLESIHNKRLAGLEGRDWTLSRTGEISGATGRDRASKIVFKRIDAELTLNFINFELKEARLDNVFELDLPPGIKKIDYR
ncbi:hypothetical protein GX441_06240 [bacterium]|nr:hypothetical protein [bacterium]